jgi:arylsulfatase A-like enzyme
MLSQSNRRDFLKTIACGAVVGLAGVNGGLAQASGLLQKFQDKPLKRRPNIVVILSDDQRADMLSCMGNKYVQTPNIDRLAKEGLVFENAFCTAGVCSPSRASILTGKYPHQCGAPGILWCNNTFLRNETLFPTLLHQAGYYTAHIGKFHLGQDAMPKPGYDYWAGFEWLGEFFKTKVTINGAEKQFEGFSDDILASLAAEQIKEAAKKDAPFFVFVGLKAPHLPFSYDQRYKNFLDGVEMPKPPSYNEDYDVSGKPAFMKNNLIRIDTFQGGLPMFGNSWDTYVKAYYRSSQCLNDAAGVILKAIDETGEAQDTIVIYSSDQGYSLGEHGNTEKHYAYEGVMRVPMLVRYPRMIKAGIRRKEMALNIDIAPTLLDLAGASIPADMAGQSWRPVLDAKKETPAKWRDDFLFKQESPGDAIPGQIAVRTERYKLITYQSFPDRELYDLQNDPLEIKNVVTDPAYANVLKDMELRLARLKKETDLRPYIDHPVGSIYILGPLGRDSNKTIDEYLVKNSGKFDSDFNYGGKSCQWQRVPASSPGIFRFDSTPQAENEILIAFIIEVLDKKDPGTRLVIAPALPMIGYANGERIWDSQVGAINHFNPPLRSGANAIVLKVQANLSELQLAVNAPQGSIGQ